MKIIAPIGLLMGLSVTCAATASDFPGALFAVAPSGLTGTEPVAALPALPGGSLDRALPRGRDGATPVRPVIESPKSDAGNAIRREPPGTPHALMPDRTGLPPGLRGTARKPRAVLSWQSLLPGSIQ